MSKSAKTRAQLDAEIRAFTEQGRHVSGQGYNGNRIAKVGFGTYAQSPLAMPPAEGYRPRRQDRRDPALPKNETFAAMDRSGKILGTSRSVKGAMEHAPNDKTYATVRGEFTSDGTHWSVGHGRVMATREFDTSGGFRWYVG